MRLPKISKNAGMMIAAGVILLAFITVIYLEEGMRFSITAPKTAADLSRTTSDTYSDTRTALKSDPTLNQNASTTDAVTAAAYSLQDNAEIWSWNEGKRWPIASLTKLMTALVANNLIPMDQRITVSSTDEGYLAAAGAAATLKTGDTLTAKDLITSMFIVSSDDAAEALADYYGRTKFIQAMNEMAQSLGMNNTFYASPSGLSVENLSTTADLYKLVEFIWSTEPGFFQTTRETKANITIYGGAGGSAVRVLTNIDKFAGRKDFLGGKTGTLPVSAENLISIFNLNGPKAIIVLGSTNRYTETESILSKL